MVEDTGIEDDNNKMKTVTVIIPTFNRWPDVCSAIDSCLNQSYKKTKCMVVDDASTDSTVALLRDKYGSYISIVSSSVNKGQSFCRNLGVKSSDSDFVCFLDSDDALEHDAVEKRMSLFNELKEDVRVSFGVFRTLGTKRNDLLYKKKRGDKLLLEEYFDQNGWCNNNGFLIDRKVFLADGMYNSRLRNKEDIELILRLLSKHPFYYCGTEIGVVRDVCGSNRARYNYEGIISQEGVFADIVLGNVLLREALGHAAIQKLICSDTEEILRSLYKLGKYGDYRSSYKQAVKLGNIKNSRRFSQRFWLSYVKELSNKIIK